MLELESERQAVVEVPTSAAREALRNWQRNLIALAATQPDLAAPLTQSNPQVEWVFARDGALTALENGKWWSGCSVPVKAAQELLKTLQITSAVACLLAPSHCAQISFALSRLKSEQAVIVILSRPDDLALFLHCHDFSADIPSHRLWFISGDDWPREMSQLFHSNPGLPIPQQFIRTALLNDEASAPLIAAAQKIFADELNRRSVLLSELRQARHPVSRDRKRITLAAPMRFRLWEDAGGVLEKIAEAESNFDWTIINFDDPAHASPLALASAAAECDAVFAANLTRADCAQFIHPDIPLIAWLTTRPVPAFDQSTAHDVLLLPGPRLIDAAKESGWPADHLALALWPSIASSTGTTLTIIADTRSIDPSASFDLSSHQLLWNLIRSELQNNPPLIKNDVLSYLHSRMKQLNVSETGLDQRRFIEHLIIPVYQQSIAAHLLDAKIPLRIFGQGWSGIPQFSPHANGPISSHEELKQAVASTSALIHLWPSDHPHPIDTAGPPVIRLGSRGLTGLICDARRAAAGNLIKPPPPAADCLDMATIAGILRAVLGN